MKLTKNNLELEIDEKFMEPTSLKLNGREFLYQKTATWKKDFPTLFPICGMLIDDEYQVDNQTYKLTRHGFFREINDWKLVDAKKDYAKFNFKSHGEFLELYPWEFSLDYEFELENDSLIMTTTVTNLSNSVMYYSLGYHPAFITKKSGIINFDNPQKLFTDSVDLKYLVRSSVNGVMINNTKVSDLDFSGSQFFWTTNNQSSKVSYSDDVKSFEIDLQPYLNKTFILWSEDNDSGYVCFEPMDGCADFDDRKDKQLKNKDQIIFLQPNEVKKHFFKIALKTN